MHYNVPTNVCQTDKSFPHIFCNPLLIVFIRSHKPCPQYILSSPTSRIYGRVFIASRFEHTAQLLTFCVIYHRCVCGFVPFLANVNSLSCSLYAITRPSVVWLSVVCNVRAPYSGGSNFRQYFYGIRYTGHPLTSTDIHWNFHGDRSWGTPPPGELNTRRVAKYSDFRPVDCYISETVQDRK